ncbi:uncharacterized protein EKO05_0011163 [Ascochyta rabiei]|uniref:GTP binding n=1 Tax=Didymella rabiei TaxID=5454 RepID=A0A163A7I0_DIDRA|nr:uncharacterized protein EKO05_0011163 [Ascochyta rabiei]KZM21030.1 GTP binding [Ascochyta rabiei]UPX20955.1 hypothetical protein EKO05_0011163 [Ascochyta rabiei]
MMVEEKVRTSGNLGETLTRGSLHHIQFSDVALEEFDPNHPLQGMDESRPTESIPEYGVLIVGLTGSGKSTFISLLADETVQIGHDLSSCTVRAQGYAATVGASSVFLLDTPGFDDTDRSDLDVVSEIVTGLHILSRSGVSLVGVIYIQRITDTRMSGSSRKSLEILKAICGVPASVNITFVTTMWDKLGPNSDTVGEERTEEMKRLFLAEFIEKGAQVQRHSGTVASARGIVDRILSNNKTVTLEIEHEMIEEGRLLEQTQVGRILQRDLKEQQKEFDVELKEIEQQLLEAQQSNDSTAVASLSEDLERHKENLERLHYPCSQLHYNVQQLGERRAASLGLQPEEARQLSTDVGDDTNDEIRSRIRRTNQRAHSLRQDQDLEIQSFNAQFARLQNEEYYQRRERDALARARRRAEARELERPMAILTVWQHLFRVTYLNPRRSRY